MTSDKDPETEPAPVPLIPSWIFFKIVLLVLELIGIAGKFPSGVTGVTEVFIEIEMISAEDTSWDGGQEEE